MSMEYVLKTEQDRCRLIGAIQALDLEKAKKVSVKEADRSSQQNRALHAALSDIADQVEHYGKKFDSEVWKRLCTAAWLREAGEQAQLIPALDGNGFDLIFQKTSKLSVKDCASLIDWIIAFGSEHQVRWSQPDYWAGRY